MCILIGVRFLFIKSLICKAFSILFDDIRLCGALKTVAAEPFSFSPITPFNERPQNPFTQKCELPCDLDLRAVVENEGDLADSVEKHSFSVKALCVFFLFWKFVHLTLLYNTNMSNKRKIQKKITKRMIKRIIKKRKNNQRNY